MTKLRGEGHSLQLKSCSVKGKFWGCEGGWAYSSASIPTSQQGNVVCLNRVFISLQPRWIRFKHLPMPKSSPFLFKMHTFCSSNSTLVLQISESHSSRVSKCQRCSWEDILKLEVLLDAVLTKSQRNLYSNIVCRKTAISHLAKTNRRGFNS